MNIMDMHVSQAYQEVCHELMRLLTKVCDRLDSGVGVSPEVHEEIRNALGRRE